MRIAIFTDTFPPQTNGVAHSVLQTGKKLAQRNHQVIIFATSKTGKKYLDKDIPNLDIITLSSLPALVYPNERITVPLGNIKKKLTEFNPEIIHVHTPFGAGWMAVAGAKNLDIPLVGTHHTFFDHYLKYIKIDFNWMKKFSWKFTVAFYNKCHVIISPTESLSGSLSDAGVHKKLAVVSNSIDTNLFRPAPDELSVRKSKRTHNIPGKAVVYMGRLAYEKSIDKVIDAFALAKSEIPDLSLILIGDGPVRKDLEKQTKKLGILDSVIFTGFLYKEDLVKALWAGDVFITASKSENMPLSLIEAMATGLPMVAVKEKGIAEMIIDGVNGYFAKTDDSNDIAEKLLLILQNNKKRESFAKESRSIALGYSEEVIMETLENLYKETIEAYNLKKTL